MITYFIDKEEKHLDDLLFHLRKHNVSNTGVKASGVNYIYTTHKNNLKGAMKSGFSWDWATLSNIHYDNLKALQNMVSKACTLYKDLSGIKIHTNDKQIYEDFITLGFTKNSIIEVSPKEGKSYCATYSKYNINKTTDFHTISSKDIVNEYDIIMKEKTAIYNQTYNVIEKPETVLYTAKDNDKFVGGVYMELYHDTLYVDLLAVHEDYKKQSIGTQLMDLALVTAQKNNFVSISLGTAQFQAKEFYQKLGYKVVSTIQNQPKGFECYTMIKEIRSEV